MEDVVWIDLLDPDPGTLAHALEGDVHPTAVGQILAPSRHEDEPRPRLEAHDDYLFGVLVVPVIIPAKTRILYQEIDFVARRTRLVTVRKTPPGGEALKIDRVRAGAQTLRATPGLCVHSVFDEVAERCLALVNALDEALDELEDNVEGWPAEQVRGRISQLRHDILHFRRVVSPTRDLVRAVLDNRVELDGHEPIFSREVRIHFADAHHKLLRVSERLDLSRDLLAGIRDDHQAHVTRDQNKTLRRVAVIVSVLLLPSFILGLSSRNVHGPAMELFHDGTAWSWALVVVITVAGAVYFRRKKWI